MDIGKKIRELRIAKLMTQSELAGNHITRNMLSCIENGTAQPSISTVVYLAGRLNVPAGFLLAEESDELLYRKMNSITNIKRAYTAGDWLGCRSLCLSGCPEPDDEINLLLADCDAEIAAEEFFNGRLRSSCRFFDEALKYAERTVYRTDHITARAALYFGYMQRISATLSSDVLDDGVTVTLTDTSPFARYVQALESLDRGERQVAEAYLDAFDDGDFFTEHIRTCLMMQQGQYADAMEHLLMLLRSEDTPLNEIGLYTVLCELEICCRETGDYKGAYEYATEKLQQLEKLLNEI